MVLYSISHIKPFFIEWGEAYVRTKKSYTAPNGLMVNNGYVKCVDLKKALDYNGHWMFFPT